MSVVNQSVQDGISDRGFSDMIVPMFDGELTGQEGGGGAMTFLDDFQEISSLCVIQGSQTQVIQDQEVGFGEFLHEVSITSIDPGQSDLVEELGEAEVKGLESFSAGFLSESTGQERFSHTGGTRDQEIAVFLYPVAGEETEDHGFVDSPGSFIVDIFHRGLKFEFGIFEETLETKVLFPGPLAVDEDSESFFEGEIVEGGLVELIFKALGHSEEFHGVEFIEGLFIEHRLDSFLCFDFNHKKINRHRFCGNVENLLFFQGLVERVENSSEFSMLSTRTSFPQNLF
jgi:hypothetical protein